MKIKILVLIYLCISSINCKSATLQELLSAYCVPTNASGCGSKEKATFTGGSISTTTALNSNYCQCGVEDYYYDKTSRFCKLCNDGTYNRDNKATVCKNVCAAGYLYEKVEKCPAGYFKKCRFLMRVSVFS